MKTRDLLYLTIITGLILLVLRGCEKEIEQERIYKQQISWLEGDIKTRINDLGQQTSETASLIGANQRDVRQAIGGIENLNDEQKRVVRMLEESKGLYSGIALSVKTALEGKSKVIVSETDSVWPTYRAVINEDWISGDFKMDRFDFDYDICFVNQFDLKQTRSRNFLKKDRYQLEVTNLNPYTSTTGQSSFLLTPTPKRLGLGVSLGYGVSGDGFQPYLGLGINYTVIHL